MLLGVMWGLALIRWRIKVCWSLCAELAVDMGGRQARRGKMEI